MRAATWPLTLALSPSDGEREKTQQLTLVTTLDIGGEGDEAAVFAQDSAHGDDQGFDLQLHCGVMRGFEDDFERDWINTGWSGENTLVLFIDDTVARGEAINDCVDIARQNFAGFGEGGAKQVFGESMAANKSVETLAGIVSV